MIPWSVTMRSTLILNCVLTTWLFTSIGAITVSIDRSDKKPPPTRSSMIANGWRPLSSNYEETIGTNVSPSSSLERNAVPLHPVITKLQEHMATSEKLKAHRKSKPNTSNLDYNPPSILGSFTVFGNAAAKARGEAQSHNHASKHVGSETREYTFLIPPPKDAYRFELDQQRKPIIRDNGAYLRQPQFVPQNVHQAADPIRAATYFIKGYTSTTNSPSSQAGSSKNRHYMNGYNMAQLLQPPTRHQPKPFESLKVSSNGKPYYQPPGTMLNGEFLKDKRVAEHERRANYDKYQSQPQNGQIVNGAGHFYTQVSHPSHLYKTSYERDPAFLVHESHEVSYVTPPGVYNGYNFRPSLPYETLLPPDVYTSSTPVPTTILPRVQQGSSSKYSQPNDAVAREHEYNKRPGQSSTIKQTENSALQSEILPTSGITNTYYVSEHQDLTPPPAGWPAHKTKYTSDINEVLPRVNPASKFHEDAIGSNQIPQIPKIVYVRPAQQYQSPIDPRPENHEAEYETPESISLKHFNEQQFLIQQQLVQRDRQRLAEQERQQQIEIERQQQEELQKRQEEVRRLIHQQREEEEARLAVESVKNQSDQLAKVTDEQTPYTVQLAEYEIPKVTTDGPTVSTERNNFGEQPGIHQIFQTEHTPSENPLDQIQRYHQAQNHQYQEQLQNRPLEEDSNYNYREPQTELVRPSRPQKPSRDQYRRRKPTTVAYDATPTEPPIQPPETSVPLTLRIEDVPLQTTVPPETVTLPSVTSQRPRTRRPGVPPRRRRPTTTTEEPIVVGNGADDFLKYNRPAEEGQHQQLDAARRRRIKPTQQNPDEIVTEKRANIRKRPGHRNRVNPGEPFEAEIVTEVVQSPVQSSYKDHKYNGNDEFVTNQPNNQYFDYTSQRFAAGEEQREETTEPVQLEYLTEVAKTQDTSVNEDHNRQYGSTAVTSIPLENLFVRTEGDYFDRATVVSSSSTSTTTSPAPSTSTTQETTQPPQVSSSTSRSHKIRPIRYGNTTRPRFSIKDYKTRLDYKSRLSQMSSTESSVTSSPTKQRGSIKNQQSQQQNSDSARETTGRYKYVSRVNYRTTSASPSTQKELEHLPDEASTTERSNRFVPKRRPISGNVYRSRISGTTGSPNRPQHESESPARASTARPENIFSSSVRRRPVMKSRLAAQKETSTAGHVERKEEEATEMAAEETSFYSAVTTMATTRLLANEIPIEKGEIGSTSDPIEFEVEEKNVGKSETGTSYPFKKNAEPVLVSSTTKTLEESQVKETEVLESDSDAKTAEHSVELEGSKVETTTRFDVRSEEEELFAKASQSVADLTSSASALYDKPGMFKAVSPESRVVSPHFKITTDEPTLPIEAFFQELSKKN